MNTISAKNVADFAQILCMDEKNRPISLLIPGHEGRKYEVTLLRDEKDSKNCVRFSCKQAGDKGEPCKGCQHSTICYHVLAALLVTVKNIGHLEFFETRDIPSILEEFGRRVVRLENTAARKVLWAVFWPYKPKNPKKQAQADQVSLELASSGPKLFQNGPYDDRR